MAEKAERVAKAIIDLIDHPRPEVYTRPERPTWWRLFIPAWMRLRGKL